MRVIFIGGEPAVGKTAILNKLRNSLESKKECSYKKLLKYEKYGKIIILGRFPSESANGFAGTDLLSMSVHPVAVEWVKKNKDKDLNVVVEGDRLFTKKFIDSVMRLCTITIIFIITSEKEKFRRHKERKDDQTDKFLKSRKTKVKNMFRDYSSSIILDNELLEDIDKSVAILNDLLNSKTDKDFLKKEKRYKVSLSSNLKSKYERIGIFKYM